MVKVVSTIKSRTLLSLAILRELYNKVNYYRAVVNRNINQYNEYKEKMSKIAPEKVRDLEKEVETLRSVDSHLNNIMLFIEGIILRLETLITAGNVVVAALALKDVVKVLRHHMKGAPPILAILVDKLDEISKSLVNEIRIENNARSSIVNLTPEASKIVEEAKKVAGIK